MDREWVKNNDRLSDQYTRGVKEFLDFAFSHARSSMISCPCTKCHNVVVKNRDDVEADLIIHGMSLNYDIWTFHGESYHHPTNETVSDENDDMYGMIHDAIGFRSHADDNDDRQGEECHIEEEPNEEAEIFYRLLKNAEQQLYPGCEKFSALSFIVKLLHIKCLNGWSNKSFTMLLEVLKQALPDGNKELRRDVKNFDGNKELRRAPNILSGLEVLDQLHGINIRFGKKNNMISTREREKKKGNMPTTGKNKQKHKVGLSDKAKKIVKGKKRSLRENSPDKDKKGNWKKKSIFFDLPYWKFLLIRHNLDVMHIEKNVCDNIIGTLLNIDGKTKDNLKSRLDLEIMGIRKELHPVRLDNGKMFLPPACYTLSQKEKTTLCEFLKEIKVPDGYSSNISRCVYPKECKLKGLKSHDCHIIIQRLLPLAIRGLLPDHVCGPITELCHFFRDLGSKVLKMEDLDRLEAQIPLTLCKLEMTFPPSFFDIMVHLVIHLTREAKLAGPVQYRWMYPIERYLYNLKCYVRNRSHPEGSIAEGYLADECLTFCSRYLSGVETKFTRDVRNDDGGPIEISDISVFKQRGRPIGKSTIRELAMEELQQARLYVLKNCEEMSPFVKEYEETNESSHVRDKNSKDRHLLNWVENHVARLHKEGSTRVDDSILSIARGPTQLANSYAGYIVNGFRFDTRDREKDKITQNSGVSVKGESSVGNFDYYGVLTEIIELFYLGSHRVFLFKCDWWDVQKGIIKDNYGNISLNFSRKWPTNEPFVLACQSEQVFYVKDLLKPNYRVVIKTQPRDIYDIPVVDHEVVVDNLEPYQQTSNNEALEILENNYDVTWNRTDICGEIVDVPIEENN